MVNRLLKAIVLGIGPRRRITSTVFCISLFEGALVSNRYRVLDLSSEKGILCGKILADLGMDVIKIEKPDGDDSRNVGPFFHDDPHPERSLFWFAFNTGKRSITLDLDTVEGKGLFMELVKKTDFVIESFTPGHMTKLGLDYSSLRESNRGLIYISISGFGQTGPYSVFKAPDTVVTAMCGLMNLMGDPNRMPLRIGLPQAYLHAGAEAAVAALIALWHREMGGEGQHVDVSAQESFIWETVEIQQLWNLLEINMPRLGVYRLWGRSNYQWIFPCRDGYVCFVSYNPAPIAVRSRKVIVEWMDSEGMADDYIKSFDWEKVETASLAPEEVQKVMPYFARFLATKTKKELLEKSLEVGMVLAPLISVQDAVVSPQHKARGFWVEIEHSELGTKLVYPGAPYISTTKDYQVRERAPLIGEHNEQIYMQELGMTREELVRLKGAGVL